MLQLRSNFYLLLYLGASLSLASFTSANYNHGSPTPSLPIPPPNASSPSYEEESLPSPSIPLLSNIETPKINIDDNSAFHAPPPVSISISSSTREAPPPNNAKFEAWTPTSSPKIGKDEDATIVKDGSPIKSSIEATPINCSSKSSPCTNDSNANSLYEQGGWHKRNPNPRWQHNNNHHYYNDSSKPSPTNYWPNHPSTNNPWPRPQWPKPWSPRNQTATWRQPYWPNQPDNATRADRWHGSHWPRQGRWRPRGSSTSAWPPLPARAASPPCEEAAPPFKPPHRWRRPFSRHF